MDEDELSITRKRKPIRRDYFLHGEKLASVKHAKYLGVTIQEDLRWDKHINEVTTKASKTLGFLRRNIKTNSRSVKETAYKSLVRPLVEYASPAWDPYTAKDINRLEMVQRRAARYVTGRYHNRSSVTDMLGELGWTSL